jgi:hypothetical protein
MPGECRAGFLANSASECRKRLPHSYNEQVKRSKNWQLSVQELVVERISDFTG